jgi:hypothetical protein
VNVQAPPMLIGSMCRSFTWRFFYRWTLSWLL